MHFSHHFPTEEEPVMATEAQIEANRRNAAKSTGPRTEEGKEKSSRNATKFGLFTRHVLLPDEDEAELGALRDGIADRLKPADALEEVYVERVVATTWRLQRALSGENTIFREWKRDERLSPVQVLATDRPIADLERLQRHIAALERSIDKALAELSKLQKLRKESSDDENEENEPNSEASAPEVTASAPIEIVKTNPIREEQPQEGIENEPNSTSDDQGRCVAGTSTAPGSIPRFGSLGQSAS
jgi:hypothetical protein